jgi:Zn-dependent protease
MLLEPERTQFDLSWRMFGIRMRVHPMFWLIACVLGARYLDPPYGALYLLLWVACVFVSILVHELGHVLMGRIFGRDGEIVLYSFGGLAIGSYELPSRWQRIAVSFAGPFAGFCLLGVVLLVGQYLPPREDHFLHGPDKLWTVMDMLYWMNLVWGLMNLLPIWPLDGGQISRELSVWVSPRHGARVALGLSFLLAAVLAVHCLMVANNRILIPFLPIGGMYTAILFALLALESLLLLQQTGRSRQYRDSEDDPWARY